VTSNQFKTETENDGTQVETLNGKVEGLGVTSDERINNLRQQMEYKRDEVERANEEYLAHLKTVQETAYYGELRLDGYISCLPCCASVWIPVFGWVAGPVVAGIHSTYFARKGLWVG
jgi:hypothetical protein